MSTVMITPLPLLGADDRGTNHLWQSNRRGDFMLVFRKAGSSSGQHYHEGKSAYKNPEIMFLVSGTIELHWCGLAERQIQQTTIQAPARIEIPIKVWHEVRAVTDCHLLELNSLTDVEQDSVRIWRNEFENMLRREH